MAPPGVRGALTMTFCTSCGAPVALDAHFCSACGRLANVAITSDAASIVNLQPDTPAAISSSTHVPQNVSSEGAVRDNAITWPFHQKNWFSSLWILLVGWFPLPLPMILSFGWLLDAAARRAQSKTELLPKARDLLRMYLYGIVVWFALAIYFIFPLMIFGAIFSVEFERINEDFGRWIVGWLTNVLIQFANFFIGIFSSEGIPLVAQQTFAALFLQELTSYSGVVLALVIYLIIGVSLFLAGTLRFAATSKISSYFGLFKNLGLVIAHLPRFLLVALLLLVLNLVLGLIPVVGSLLWVTSGVWIIAYLIGSLATKSSVL